MSAARRAPIVCIACAAMALGFLGCGVTSTTTHSATSSNASSSARAVWAARTQQLCIQRRAAISRLGGVHITYAGIARVGLPAAKSLLDRYFARLLVILRVFHERQLQNTPPPSVAPAMAVASAISLQSQAATSRLRAAVLSVTTATQLHAAFQTWLAAVQPLVPRDDAIARELNLRSCLSSAAAASV